MAARAMARLCVGPYARAVYEALKAEEAQPSPERGRVTVSIDGDCVELRVEPRDLNSLRALLNSFLYLAHAAYAALEASSRLGVKGIRKDYKEALDGP